MANRRWCGDADVQRAARRRPGRRLRRRHHAADRSATFCTVAAASSAADLAFSTSSPGRRTISATASNTSCGDAGLRLRHPQALRRRPRRRGHVQDHLADLDRADAVDHRVMGLGDHRDPVPLQALDQVHLPQRPAVVQRPGHQPGRQVAQLLVAARLGQGRAADVVGDVEVGVVDPDRTGQPARHLDHLLPVAGHQGQPLLDQRDQAVVVEAGRGACGRPRSRRRASGSSGPPGTGTTRPAPRGGPACADPGTSVWLCHPARRA